ncbi:MAG: ATP-dependent helicase, partial [Mesorhizobium sp.]
APHRAGRKGDDARRERKPRGGRHAGHEDEKAQQDAAQSEQQSAIAEGSATETSDRRERKEAIRSENTERGNTRPSRRDNNRPARHHQDDNDGTVGFGDDVPAFMRIVAKV